MGLTGAAGSALGAAGRVATSLLAGASGSLRRNKSRRSIAITITARTAIVQRVLGFMRSSYTPAFKNHYMFEVLRRVSLVCAIALTIALLLASVMPSAGQAFGGELHRR